MQLPTQSLTTPPQPCPILTGSLRTRNQTRNEHPTNRACGIRRTSQLPGGEECFRIRPITRPATAPSGPAAKMAVIAASRFLSCALDEKARTANQPTATPMAKPRIVDRIMRKNRCTVRTLATGYRGNDDTFRPVEHARVVDGSLISRPVCCAIPLHVMPHANQTRNEHPTNQPRHLRE